MAKANRETIVNLEPKPAKMKYAYICSACTNDAIETSNKMLSVTVNCKSCGKLIELNNANNYKKI